MFGLRLFDPNPLGLSIYKCNHDKLVKLSNGSYVSEQNGPIAGHNSLPINGQIEIEVLNERSAKLYLATFNNKQLKELERVSNGFADLCLSQGRRVIGKSGQTTSALKDYIVQKLEDESVMRLVSWYRQ
ncbi:hypothetical protein D5018_09600 [Parashewanella curva]|uniref:Uncharacterized protein n=1 Tax=Parashewanella curva TaxID=2338552 RepID=A0A3L8PX17_9GAMM|nr:hypothetical protein [Parashewanella curva]RLV59926.1 hypothetical protein D5018_09600 [Parashewanella curva]